MIERIRKEARKAAEELMEIAGLQKTDILIVGCSSSEVSGHEIGTTSSTEIADAIFDGIYSVIFERGIFLAAQCCEHLNRALILPKEAAEFYGYEIVNVVPMPKAGGSFATAAYQNLLHPVAVEEISAKAGMDIGDTLIGMHLKRVAVPVRLSVLKIGNANLVCAKTRPKYIGGERSHYDKN